MSMPRWLDEGDDNDGDAELLPKAPQRYKYHGSCWTITALLGLVVTLTITMYFFVLFATAGLVSGAALDRKQASSASAGTASSATVPQYFQTSPEIYAGPTQTAAIEPFLAQTNKAPFGHPASPTPYVPNAPLQTALPIANVPNGTSIFQLTGQLSSYFPSPGFGANEYALPPGTNITTVNVLHRHGSRYPTGDSSVSTFGSKVYNLTHNGTASWSGNLTFLNNWQYTLGAEILTARGRQELFDSGVLHYYNYGGLYNTSTKIVARTTTQDRMLKSAEYFMAGFFGLEWTHNVTLEPQIELNGYNSSLAGYFQCNNSNNFRSTAGTNASLIWENIYLANATKRLSAMSGNYNWTVADAYNAQTLCPYETVAYGYSPWCALFTYEEWQGYEYSIDLQFHGNNGFGSPTGRGVGIGYVQEFYARLQHHLYNLPPGATNVNRTLDTMNSTFPVNQTLYFDFSHDTNIMSIITAFGLKQFGGYGGLPATSRNSSRGLVVSHTTPFGARMVWEVIKAPQPVKAQRPVGPNVNSSMYYDNGAATQYVHLLINQRTVPLNVSYPQCGNRDDGWCEMGTFLNILNGTLALAQYNYSCFGNYAATPYGNVTNGVPISKRDISLGLALGGKGSSL